MKRDNISEPCFITDGPPSEGAGSIRFGIAWYFSWHHAETSK